ncbi:aminotransferase class I/II-fold pyridoxal phosphate-dependent enzyme [Lentibacillus cibarius]|uniref:Aminotransferase n=1 Tax=Lentibacillus cibarius TaxID=2583219 RepID=A0A549YI98_9BACI|nr:LL-diaminopimelate aminotransferase [Lentibacillus cibarius]TRM11601.1 aminotransferase class I/II-fold pyridoxal phosphate-dependent enzyme [Lentibacillus cibarius]
MPFVSDKVKNLPPYLFASFQRKKKELEANGVDVIDLGIGAPDLPAPSFVVDRLAEEAKHTTNHRYSTYSGCAEFREAVAEFYKSAYDVDLDPDTEVLALIGSKEGIANLMHAVINPGDTVLVPNPGYPAYRTAVQLAGGVNATLPLDDTNGYVPMYEQVDKGVMNRAKMMLLNYPGNPTAATAEFDTFLEAVTRAAEHDMLLVHDAAYDMITFNGYKAPSVLQVPNAKERAIELGSLSKSFNMTGWRIGYAVGNAEVIEALATLKSNIDTSQFLPIQKAAAAALRSDFSAVEEHSRVYQARMEKLYSGFRDLGIYADKPNGTIFLWAQVPDGYSSMEFANKLLYEAGVIVTPGHAFGSRGEGYFRVALTVDEKRLDEVITRMKRLDIKEGTRP